MSAEIRALDDAQAQRVLVELFELLPGSGKPGYDESDSLLNDLREAAPTDLAGPLGHLGDSAALRGALARHALEQLAAQPAVQPLVAQAVERAARPHMLALPELIAGVIVVLAALPSHIEKDAKGGLTIQWHQLQNLAALLKPVGEIVKALPKSLLDKLH
jgi:hypothetical protein